jgi:O-antigen ligase
MTAIRTGLCALFVFCVLAHGVVEVWSESVLEMGAAVLLLAWAIVVFFDPKEKIQWNSLNWPLLGFLFIGLGQLLFHGTAYAFLTRTELLKLAAYFIVFFLSAQAFRDRASLVRLAWFLIFFCFTISLLTIIQHFTAERESFGLPTFTLGSETFGPFLDRNHFAGFVELLLPVGLALLVFRGLRRDLFALAGLLTIVPMGALILSGSRAGIISFGFELAVLALLARSRRSKEGPRMAAIGIVALAAVALMAWLGVGRAIERFSTIRPGEVSLSRRATMSRGAAHIFLAHPVWGAGLGAFVAVYPLYETAYDGRLVDHAHNDYMEELAETGLLGILCGLVFLWILFRDARKILEAEQGHFSRALHAGAIVAISGILLHSFVDFNLHIPSNALLFLLQGCLATSPPLPSRVSQNRRRESVKAYDRGEMAERAPSS